MRIANTRQYLSRVAFMSSLALLVFLVPLSGVSFASSGHSGCSSNTLCSFRAAQAQGPASALRAASPAGLTVGRVWTRDGHGKDKSAFKGGDSIQYALYVDNSTGKPITAEFQFEVYWGTVDYGVLQILDHIFTNVTIPTGVTGYDTSTTVPHKVLPGAYTLRVTVSNQTAPGLARGSGSFHVTGATDTPMTYYDQYAVSTKHSDDCGPASVAMALSRWHRGPGGDAAGITKLRDIMKKPGNTITVASDLVTALNYYKTHPTRIDRTDIPAPGVQLNYMAAAVLAGQPAIVLVDGNDFGRTYSGHWLVLHGIRDNGTSTQVDLLDPDKNPYGGSYAGGKIRMPLSTFIHAVADELNNDDSIVVTGP